MMYTTVSAVKLRLGIDTSEQDALISRLIVEAQATIDDYCRTTFGVAVDSTRTFDAICDVDGRTLYVDRHLCEITSVVNGDGAPITPDQYSTKPANEAPYYALALKSNQSLTWTYSDAHENAIAITGRWGYSSAVPVAVARATNRLVEMAINSQGKGGYSELDVEDLSVTLAPILQAQADVLTDLQPYRRL